MLFIIIISMLTLVAIEGPGEFTPSKDEKPIHRYEPYKR